MSSNLYQSYSKIILLYVPICISLFFHSIYVGICLPIRLVFLLFWACFRWFSSPKFWGSWNMLLWVQTSTYLSYSQFILMCVPICISLFLHCIYVPIKLFFVAIFELVFADFRGQSCRAPKIFIKKTCWVFGVSLCSAIFEHISVRS